MWPFPCPQYHQFFYSIGNVATQASTPTQVHGDVVTLLVQLIETQKTVGKNGFQVYYNPFTPVEIEGVLCRTLWKSVRIHTAFLKAFMGK